MIRRFDAILSALFLALVVGAAVPTDRAAAQYYPSAPPPYRGAPPADGYEERLPPLWLDDEDESRQPVRPRASQRAPQNAPPGVPGRILPDPQEADAVLPAPGFAVPYGRRMPPVSGHQLNAAPPAGADGPDVIRPPAAIGAAPQSGAATVTSLPPEDQPEVGEPKQLAPELKRQLVDFPTKEPAGTIVIDTQNTFLYLTLGGNKAVRYGIGVGREGFTWAGTERISRMKEWPDWFPPAEMIERQPYLPRFMAGGDGNPLGARALYLGKTLYRIHGTNQPSTIGKFVSSGCIRLLNGDIEDLYSRVQVGTRVVVLPGDKPPATAANIPAPAGGPTPNGPASAGPIDLTAPNTAAITSSPLPPPPQR